MKPDRSMGVMVAMLLALLLAACSKPETAPALDAAAKVAGDLAAAPAAAAAAQSEADLPKACALVSAQEMSAILGGAVTSQANEGSSGKTECIYSPAQGISPYAEFSVEWGEGQTAMNAAGAMAKQEDGMVSPYAGIGDQAISVGTVLMIRKGNDLVSITLSGVDDMPAAARRIYDTAAARL